MSIRIPTIMPITVLNIPRILLRIHHTAKNRQLRLSRTASGTTLTILLPPKALRYPTKPLRPMVKSRSITLSANALDKAFTSIAL
jgi:hypothetical protein